MDVLFYRFIWNKVSNKIKKEFDSEPTYNKKNLKIKNKSYSDKAADFQDKKMPKALIILV